VAQLGSLYTQAEGEKTHNPVAAVGAYQRAMTIDGQVARGTHAGYFRGQIGRLAKQAAQSAFAQQRFDAAFEMAKAALRFTGDDGGVGAQLRSKAAELNGRAQSMARSNPNGAKNLWRMVLRMVPPSDPNYMKASQGLSAASSAARDEDED
jgi:hypothetical protein